MGEATIIAALPIPGMEPAGGLMSRLTIGGRTTVVDMIMDTGLGMGMDMGTPIPPPAMAGMTRVRTMGVEISAGVETAAAEGMEAGAVNGGGGGGGD